MVRASEFLSGIPMIVKNQLIMVKYSDGFNDHLNTGTEFGVFYGSDAVQISTIHHVSNRTHFHHVKISSLQDC